MSELDQMGIDPTIRETLVRDDDGFVTRGGAPFIPNPVNAIARILTDRLKPGVGVTLPDGFGTAIWASLAESTRDHDQAYKIDPALAEASATAARQLIALDENSFDPPLNWVEGQILVHVVQAVGATALR